MSMAKMPTELLAPPAFANASIGLRHHRRICAAFAPRASKPTKGPDPALCSTRLVRVSRNQLLALIEEATTASAAAAMIAVGTKMTNTQVVFLVAAQVALELHNMMGLFSAVV